MKMCAKIMANASDSACGGIIFGLEKSKVLEELATDYFVWDSSDEKEFSANAGSESETEPAVCSLRQTEWPNKQ